MLSAAAASPHKEVVTLSHTQDVGIGNSVFVVGNHPDLGAWDVTKAVKLRVTGTDFWSGQVAVQSGAQLQYKFIRRSTAPDQWCNPANTADVSGVQTLGVAAQPGAPYRGKTIYYLSAWNPPNLFYRSGNNWIEAPMRYVRAGRSPSESLYRIDGIGEAGEQLEFVFNNGAGSWDNPIGGGNYLTSLDAFQVQDGNVFSYEPPATVSAPQMVSQFINSTASGIPGRTIRIYLPRGYAENTTKRYPVLYLHDGQNVFDASTAFGGAEWQADETAMREMGQGRVREAILVGIDNTNERIHEYLPPADRYPANTGAFGRADAYASFVINNVRPYVDTTYRTLNDAPNTLVAGSSMGGLVSLYFGREFSTFGKIAVLSPAFWIAPNYIGQVRNGAKKPLRVWLDFGTSESTSSWHDTLEMYDIHLRQSYAANGDVTFVAGCNAGHNEAAWRTRFPAVLHYLLPAREERAALALDEHPPRVLETNIDRASNRASFVYTGQYGFVYTLERSPDFVQWSPVTTTGPEPLPWSQRTIEDNAIPAGDKMFWRVRTSAP